MTTGRFRPPGSFFFEARTTVQKANGLHIGKAQRRRFAIADRCQQSPRSREQDRSSNEAFSGTRGFSTNVLQISGLAFAHVLAEEDIQRACDEEGVDFGQPKDEQQKIIYTPAVTLGAFLSQVGCIPILRTEC
jgi:hypothetical protein